MTLWERLWNDEYVAGYQAMTGWADDHVPFPGAAAEQTVRSPDKHELRLPAGHMGLVVGRTAARTTVPTILDFIRRRSEPLAGATPEEA